jgi:hypothetical protein
VGLLIFTLSACGDSPLVVKVKSHIESQLLDPSSVQYKDVVEYSDRVVCGSYNAKNKFGGYVGFEPFVYVEGMESAEPKIKESPSFWCSARTGKREEHEANKQQARLAQCISLNAVRRQEQPDCLEAARKDQKLNDAWCEDFAGLRLFRERSTFCQAAAKRDPALKSKWCKEAIARGKEWEDRSEFCQS